MYSGTLLVCINRVAVLKEFSKKKMTDSALLQAVLTRCPEGGIPQYNKFPIPKGVHLWEVF